MLLLIFEVFFVLHNIFVLSIKFFQILVGMNATRLILPDNSIEFLKDSVI